MKHTVHSLAVLLACTLAAWADVLPPALDTFSINGRISGFTGRAGALPVTATRKAYVRFDLANLPADVLPDDIAQARLRVYFPSALRPGQIFVHTVTPGGPPWNETDLALAPEVDVPAIASFPAAKVVAKNFIEADVTATVRAWRAGTRANYGFAFSAAGNTFVTLGAKEGPGSGFPCVLEVQIDRVILDGSIDSPQLANGAVTNPKLANPSLTIAAGVGLEGGGTVALGGTVKLSLQPDLTLGGTTMGTFKGDGSALTGLSAANLTGDLTVAPLASSTIFQINLEGGISGADLGHATAQSVAVAGNYAYLGDGVAGVYIIDVPDPSHPIAKVRLPENALGNGASNPRALGVAVQGQYLYVANGSAGLRIVDISDPLNPVLKGNVGQTLLGNGTAWKVTVFGGYAYLANGSAGLAIIDISDPQNPIVKSRLALPPFTTYAVAVSAGYAYVANESTGLRVVDISDPQNPVIRSTVAYTDMGGSDSLDVAVAGTYAYVANKLAGLAILDISSPVSPVVKRIVPLSQFSQSTGLKSVAVAGQYAYLGGGLDGGLSLFDIADPLNPVHRGTFAETRMGDAEVLQVAVSGNHVFLANALDGFRILSIGTSPAATTGSVLGGSQIVTSGGNVGIGRTPSFNKLEVEGEASKLLAGAWLANSDRRIKMDIRSIDHALERLERVRLVDFRYTEEYRAAHRGIADTRYLNVIAQEFAEVFPEHVKSSGETFPDGSSMLQVDTYPLTIYSAAAVQELNAKLKARDAELAELRNQSAELKKRLERIEAVLKRQAPSPGR
jgi:hypothetical protein